MHVISEKRDNSGGLIKKMDKTFRRVGRTELNFNKRVIYTFATPQVPLIPPKISSSGTFTTNGVICNHLKLARVCPTCESLPRIIDVCECRRWRWVVFRNGGVINEFVVI